MSWVNDYIGIPWVYGETDCWAIVRDVAVLHYKIPMSDIRHPVPPDDLEMLRLVTEHTTNGEFIHVDEPLPGDIVIMASGAHIGIVVDDLRILHSLGSEDIPGQSRLNTERAMMNLYDGCVEYFRHVTRFN